MDFSNLRKLRESLCLSQKDFAASLGCNQTTYNNYENGLRDPKSDFWEKVAKTYSVSIDYLLGLSDTPFIQRRGEIRGDRVYNLEDMLQRIEAMKKKQGYTNKTLAAAIGVAEGTLGKMLSGDTKDPQISTIIKIAECLGVSADYLIFGKEFMVEDGAIQTLVDDNMKKYQRLNNVGKALAGAYIDGLIASQEYRADNEFADGLYCPYTDGDGFMDANDFALRLQAEIELAENPNIDLTEYEAKRAAALAEQQKPYAAKTGDTSGMEEIYEVLDAPDDTDAEGGV